MIREIYNFVDHIEKNGTWDLLLEDLRPKKGLHILIEVDPKNGSILNFPGKQKENWYYYDGKTEDQFFKTNKISKYEIYSRVTDQNKLKKLDKKQKIQSFSPFVFASKIKSISEGKLTPKIIHEYYENINHYFDLSNNEKNIIKIFKNFITAKIGDLTNKMESFPENFQEIWIKLKKDGYIKIYIKNFTLQRYKEVYESYLKKIIFNKDIYNENKNGKTYGLVNFHNTFNDDKIFLKHKTAMFKSGISYRFSIEQALELEKFQILIENKVLPNPFPIFIDKKEFRNSDDIINVFKTEKLPYSEILKKIFKEEKNREFKNYYLLFFEHGEIKDFDYVEMFRFYLNMEIKDLFKTGKDSKKIKNVFQFESEIVNKIFNNSLVTVKKDYYKTRYFSDIDANATNGNNTYMLILKYRKTFFDYIYKSKVQSITSSMWDEILYKSIIDSIKEDRMEDGYHSKEFFIKEKLNIWFSLYNYFLNNEGRCDMASKIPELSKKMEKIVDNNEEHISTIDEFMFAAGQLIRYLLNQSKSSEKTHALLEPFLQKSNIEQLFQSISRAINIYKHEIPFNHKRFEKLAAEVLAFDTNENLGKYQRFMLAGYFYDSMLYKSNSTNKENLEA